MALPLVLDTDIGTDADDALALAYALRHPELDLRAVTTVSGDPLLRARIARKLLVLAGRDDVPVAAGLSCPASTGRSPWMGHEGRGLLEDEDRTGPVDRDGIVRLVEEGARAERDGTPLAVAAVGMHTNLAAALDRSPEFPRRVGTLSVMGGLFAAGELAGRPLPPDSDHNLVVDPGAAVRVLNAGMPTVFAPLDVTVRTMLTRDHRERLRSGDALCRALASLLDVWSDVLHRTRPGLPAEQVAALHDPLTVACLVNRDYVTIDRLPVTVATVGGVVRTFVDPVAGTPADVITAVAAAEFAEHMLSVIMAA